MKKKLLWIFVCLSTLSSGSNAMAQVTSVSGDGTLINNSSSTGAVTLTLGNAGADTLWGNNTSSSAAPGYQTSPQVSGTMTAGAINVATGATGYLVNNVPISLSGGQLQRGASTTLDYCPYKGNMKTTASQGIYSIPSGCLTATITNMYKGGTSGQSLTASTLYYIYLWDNSGTWVLDAETTGHATDSTTGIEIESGDNTKTLVGMVYPLAGPVLDDSGADRLVASWDNRMPKSANNTFTTTRTVASSVTGSLQEINSEIRDLILSWGDAVLIHSQLLCSTNTSNAGPYVALAIDSTSSGLGTLNQDFGSSNENENCSSSLAYTPSEGEHYVTILGASANGFTSKYFNIGSSYELTVMPTI